MPRKPLLKVEEGDNVHYEELQDYIMPDIPQVDRSQQIREYYNRLKTDGERIDFFNQMGILSQNDDGLYLTDNEDNVVTELLDEFLQPTKVNSAGKTVLDKALEKQRLKELYKYHYMLDVQLGLEHRNALSSLPQDDPQREQKATDQVRNGETAYRSMVHHAYLLSGAERVYSGDYEAVRNEAYAELEEDLHVESFEAMKFGAELSARDSQLLSDAKPSKLGISEEQDRQNRYQTQKNLLPKCDMNWADDRTMYNRPTFLDAATETEARLHYDSTYQDMPRKPGSREYQDRSKELREYARKMNTPAKRVDFNIQMNVLEVLGRKCGNASLLSNNEQDYMLEYANGLRNPGKRNENGELVLDTEKLKQNLKEMHKAQFRLQMEVGKEYRKTLDTLPLNDPNREMKAGFITQNSEPALLVGLNSMNIIYPAKNEHREVSDIAETEALEEFTSTLSAEELEQFKRGQDLCSIDPICLKGAKPKTVGLSTAELEQIEQRSAYSLIAKADMNWMKDETMDNRPTFYNQQIETDTQKRNARYYLTLDEEGKKQFIANGLLQSALDENNTVYTTKERESFRECFNHYFKPVTPDGKLDYDTFEQRVDGIADLVADGYCKAGQQYRTADLDELMGDYAVEDGTRQYVVGLINKDFVKARNTESMLKELVSQNLIDQRLVNDYIERKQTADPRAEIEDFADAFNQHRTEAAYRLPDGRKNYDAMSKSLPP